MAIAEKIISLEELMKSYKDHLGLHFHKAQGKYYDNLEKKI